MGLLKESFNFMEQLTEFTLSGPMAFFLGEFVQTLSGSTNFSQVRSLTMDFEYSRSKQHVRDFVSLFNPQNLTKLIIKEPYLEVFDHFVELGFQNITDLDVILTTPEQLTSFLKFLASTSSTLNRLKIDNTNGKLVEQQQTLEKQAAPSESYGFPALRYLELLEVPEGLHGFLLGSETNPLYLNEYINLSKQQRSRAFTFE